MTGTCLCGAVTVTVAARPDYLNECNCLLCSKTGAVWGYHAPRDVRVSGETQGYLRGDMAVPAARAHFCPTCGTTTHWTAVDPAIDQCGVNARLFDPRELAGVEHRFPDGRAWDKVSAFGYVRPHTVFG